jgi:hypothetical protein
MGRDRRELDKCTIYNYNNQIFTIRLNLTEDPSRINVTRLVQDFLTTKTIVMGFIKVDK